MKPQSTAASHEDPVQSAQVTSRFPVNMFYGSKPPTGTSSMVGQKRLLANVNCNRTSEMRPKLVCLNEPVASISECSMLRDVNTCKNQVISDNGCAIRSVKRACADIGFVKYARADNRSVNHRVKRARVECDNSSMMNDYSLCNNMSISNDDLTLHNKASTPKSRSCSSQTHQYLSANTPRKVILRKKLHTSSFSANRRKDALSKMKAKYKEKLKHICGYSSGVEHVIKDVGKYLNGDAFNFVAHQMRMSQHPLKGRRYTQEIRLLSLALYNSGPKAYSYLAEIFVLPSKTSLTKWLRNVRSFPRF